MTYKDEVGFDPSHERAWRPAVRKIMTRDWSRAPQLGRDPLPGWREHDRREFLGDEGGGAAIFRHGPVERVALLRFAADRADQGFHGVGREFLAVLRAGGARDALVHQRAAEIVGAGIEADR